VKRERKDRKQKRKKISLYTAKKEKTNIGGRLLTSFLLLLVDLKNRHEAHSHTRSSDVAKDTHTHTHAKRIETETHQTVLTVSRGLV